MFPPQRHPRDLLIPHFSQSGCESRCVYYAGIEKRSRGSDAKGLKSSEGGRRASGAGTDPLSSQMGRLLACWVAEQGGRWRRACDNSVGMFTKNIGPPLHSPQSRPRTPAIPFGGKRKEILL